MVQGVTLTYAVLAILPAAALFFTAFGRYEGSFKDTVVFLFFIGGLVAGGLLGFLALLFYNGLNELIAVVGISLLIPIALVASINRRKWQGDRHSVFNGGALGLGAAVMMALSVLYFHSVVFHTQACTELVPGWDPSPRLSDYDIRRIVGGDHALDCNAHLTAAQSEFADDHVRKHVFRGVEIIQSLLIAAGLAGLVFALGLVAGDAVRRRKQFRGAFLGTAIVIPPAVFLGELIHAWQAGTGGEWLWALVLAAYGAIVAVITERRLFIEGVTDEARRERRRRKRAKLAE